MAAKDTHGVVIAWSGTGRIHNPATGRNHGKPIMRSESWELFPNLSTAIAADLDPCYTCFSTVEIRAARKR